MNFRAKSNLLTRIHPAIKLGLGPVLRFSKQDIVEKASNNYMHWYHLDGMSADAHANGEKKCPQLGDGEHDDNLKAARLGSPEYQKGHRRREAYANDCSFA
jgi:hypothetical protein